MGWKPIRKNVPSVGICNSQKLRLVLSSCSAPGRLSHSINVYDYVLYLDDNTDLSVKWGRGRNFTKNHEKPVSRTPKNRDGKSIYFFVKSWWRIK